MTDKEIEVIVKPIFTKMFNTSFSACEYGIECYKKGMEYQGIKELATENDNLIEQHIKDVQKFTEAKEIIRTFLNMPMPSNEEVFADVGAFLTKAEQFLKDSKQEE